MALSKQDRRIDRLFSRVVRLLADGRCEACNEVTPLYKLDCSHYHSRAMKTVRWDSRNSAAHCDKCHPKFERHPNDKTDWFRKRLGFRVDEELDFLAHMTIKEHPIDKDKIEANLKESLKELEG